MKRIIGATIVLLVVMLLAAASAAAPPERVITLHGWAYGGCTYDTVTWVIDCHYSPVDWGASDWGIVTPSDNGGPTIDPCNTTVCEPPPPPPDPDPECKPGHGYGDENHCHDGPPGRREHDD